MKPVSFSSRALLGALAVLGGSLTCAQAQRATPAPRPPEQVWSRAVPLSGRSLLLTGSDEYVAVASHPTAGNTNLAALRLADGKEAWHGGNAGLSMHPSAADGRRLYVNVHDEVLGIDWRTGETVWRATGDRTGSGKLWIAGERLLWGTERGLIALDRNTSRELWRRSPAKGRWLLPHDSTADWLYAAYPGTLEIEVLNLKSGAVVRSAAFSKKKSEHHAVGALVWSARHQLLFGGESVHSPGAANYSVRAVDPQFRSRWTRSNARTGLLAGDVLICPAYLKGNDDVGDGLVGLRAQDGRELWHWGAGKRGKTQPLGTVKGLTIVQFKEGSSEDAPDSVIALHPADGREAWRLPLGQPLNVLLLGNRIVTLTRPKGMPGGTIRAYSIR